MTHPDRQRLFAALDALDAREWGDLVAKLLPIVEGHALVIASPATIRLAAVVAAAHEQN